MSTGYPRLTSRLRLGADFGIDTSFDRRGEQVAELELNAALELRAELSESLSALVAPKIAHVSALSREGDDRYLLYLDVPEAHITWALGPFHLRAGTIVFAWGASDLIAPSDVLNPLDLRRTPFGAPEEVKVPVLAAEGVVALGPITFRAVLEPVFTASRFFVYAWDNGLGPLIEAYGLPLPNLAPVLGPSVIDHFGDQLVVTDRPNDGPTHATLGLRATAALGDLELSSTFVYGFDAFPEIRFDPNLLVVAQAMIDSIGAGVPLNLLDPELLEAIGQIQEAIGQGRDLYTATYRRRTLIGGDAVLGLDPFVLKLDVAYTFGRTLFTQTLDPVRQPWLNAVLGIEYVDGERLQIILEAFVVGIFDVRSNYRLLVLEPRAAPPSTTDAGGRTLGVPGLAGVVRYTLLEGEVSFEIGAFGTLTRGDLILAPTVRWRLSDHHLVRLSGLLVEGRRDGYGGTYTTNDQLVLGYEWSL